MKKVAIFLHYRPPLQNGRSISYGQYYINKVFEQYFDIYGISFGYKTEKLSRYLIIPLKKNYFKKILLFIFLGKSPRLTHYSSILFRQELKKIINNYNPDYIYVEHVLMMQYLININSKAKIILFVDDSFLYSKKNSSIMSLSQRMRNIRLTNYEIEACNRTDYVITITEEEKLLLENLLKRKIYSIPYCVDTQYYYYNWKRPTENSILFVGDFSHYPNRAAIIYFVENIFPRLIKYDIRVKVVGRNIYKIKKYLTNAIQTFENVDDVRPFYWNSTMLIAPIFSGAGLRIKVLEAASCGIPVILSPLANLGIQLNSDEGFLATKLSEFIEQIERILVMENGHLYRISLNARKKVETVFSISSVERAWNYFIENILISNYSDS